MALPSLIGVFTYEGFRAAFDPKYGSVVFLDVFRLLGDFTLPAPGLPFTLIAVVIAAFYDSDHSAGATGYLLIVAFDIVFAGCVVIIFATQS